MTFITRNVRKPLITVGMLAVLTGFISVGCSSSETESVVVKSATVADSTPAKADNPSSTASKETASKETASSASTQSVPVPSSPPVISAVAAGEDAYAIEDTTQQKPLTDADSGYDTMEHIEFPDDPAYAVDERQLVLDTPTDAELTNSAGVVLPRIIPGMTVGMPYSEARLLILSDGWRPAPGLDPGMNNNGLDDYPEVEMCSGTGLGLCNMIFVDEEMNSLTVGTGGSGPVVMGWSEVR